MKIEKWNCHVESILAANFEHPTWSVVVAVLTERSLLAHERARIQIKSSLQLANSRRKINENGSFT